MARSTHTRTGEWGSKRRKEVAKTLRQTDRHLAIREGLSDIRDPKLPGDFAIDTHEFRGIVKARIAAKLGCTAIVHEWVCATCGGPECRHAFGPWDRA